MTARSRWAVRPGAAAFVTAGTVLGVASVYALVVVGGGMLTGDTGSPSLVLSVLATAVVAWGLEPWRVALERMATRWFGPGRRPPYDVLSGFTDSVIADQGAEGSDPAPVNVPMRMAQLLAEATDAAWAQVWLEVEGGSELAATWPPSRESEPTSVTALGSSVRTRVVVLDGERLGVLRLCERRDHPLGPVEERLFSGLAAQSGMVLLRARLERELARRADDLEARTQDLSTSRRRLVETHDAERRRLERDIHDGAQQHLVALVVNLRLAQTLAERSAERARTVLDDQVVAIDAAIESLVDLSRGIYPQALIDEGVGAALRAVLTASTIPVTVDDHGLGRLPEDVEAALYFCAVEAVQNAVKHSGASRITVDLAPNGDQVRLEVRDDGSGFKPTTDRAGHGLDNMRDRIDAVQGSFALRTDLGRGAQVLAVVPLELEAAR